MPATFEPIATTTLSSAASTITFSSIPGTYTDLRLIILTNDASGNTVGVRFNSDTGTNYSSTRLSGNGTTVSSASFTNQTKALCGVSSYSTGYFTFQSLDIFSYAGSTYKSVLNLSSDEDNRQIRAMVHLWRSTSAITSISIFDNGGGNFVSGTTATLYGILKA